MASDRPESVSGRELGRQRLLGLSFGVVFGFLLQKGGVARYEVLMGQFFLTDFTVVKVMLTAIVVGMIGVFGLRAVGRVKLHVKPTRYAANVVGGLLFGVGMGMLGYCPGTGAAALGQGSLDALAGMVGLVAGSYVYAEGSAWLAATIEQKGSRGSVMLPEVLRLKRTLFISIFVPLAILLMVGLERVGV